MSTKVIATVHKLATACKKYNDGLYDEEDMCDDKRIKAFSYLMF